MWYASGKGTFQTMLKKSLLGLSFIILLLAACQAQGVPVQTTTATVEPTPSVTIQPATLTPTGQTIQPGTPTFGYQSPTPTPLQLSFPTPE